MFKLLEKRVILNYSIVFFLLTYLDCLTSLLNLRYLSLFYWSFSGLKQCRSTSFCLFLDNLSIWYLLRSLYKCGINFFLNLKLLSLFLWSQLSLWDLNCLNYRFWLFRQNLLFSRILLSYKLLFSILLYVSLFYIKLFQVLFFNCI